MLPAWAWLRWLSPLAWYLEDSPPLTRGLGLGLIPLAALAVGSLVLAMRAFDRRDLGRG
ncbi:MAG: hypothetical protein R3F30_07485 [Planctomycetota bacterium]